MQIAHLATDEIIVSDVRERNSQEAATYLASRIVVYGFLAIIGLISLFNIVNSISMSVSARTKQYGVMRAIGMDGSQLTRMVAAGSLYLCCFRADCRLYCRSAAEPYAVRSAHYTLFLHDMASARNDALPYHSIRICCRSSCGSCPGEADSKHGNY